MNLQTICNNICDNPIILLGISACFIICGGVFSSLFNRARRCKCFGFFTILGALLVMLTVTKTWSNYNTTFEFNALTFNYGLSNKVFLFITSLGILIFAIYNMGLGVVQRAYEQNSRIYHIIVSLFCSSMIFIPLFNFTEGLNANSITFLALWEVMSIASFVLMIFSGKEPRLKEKALIYFVAMHISALFIMFGIFTAQNLTLSSIFFLIGFGIKLGLFPGHFWMADGYDALPGASSALTAGVMINMGVYGILVTAANIMANELFGYIFITVGLISALYGVIWALAQRKMKKVLAASSMENMGILLTAVGILVLMPNNLEVVSYLVVKRFAMFGFLIHLFNHSILKAQLFYCTDIIKNATGETNLNNLGGLARQLRATKQCTFVGTLGLSTLPLVAGFIGKLLIYIAAVQMMISPWAIAYRITGLLIVAILGVVGALSLFVFVKFYVMVFLGAARKVITDFDKTAENIYAKIAIYTIAIIAFAGGLFPILADIIFSEAIFPTENARRVLFDVMTINCCLMILGIMVYLIRRFLLADRNVNKEQTWSCGYQKYDTKMAYTSDSFSLPFIRLVEKVFVREEKEIVLNELYPKSFEHKYAHKEIIRDSVFGKISQFFLRHLSKLQVLQSGVMQRYLWVSIIFFITVLIYVIFSR